MAGIVGFVGLGNMGAALAANLVGAGHELVTHDIAGSARNPEGATFVPEAADVAAQAEVVVLSLPDGAAGEAVARALLDAPARALAHVVDTSTVGLSAARTIADLLAASGVGYVDAPVSGGVAGASARTLTVMYAGAPDACTAVLPVLEGLSDRRVPVGDTPGMAQAVKLANNFLSATALAATSEAVAFTTSVGVDMATVLEILNVSSGQSAASRDKFVDQVLPGRYASGFANTLMAKDVRLYLQAVAGQHGPDEIGQVTDAIWRRFADAEPGVDFTRIHPFVSDT
jgi:3-hydroxyisobutyrate dehydrogenase-like beta-hydroxyacid dehydrogenase